MVKKIKVWIYPHDLNKEPIPVYKTKKSNKMIEGELIINKKNQEKSQEKKPLGLWDND